MLLLEAPLVELLEAVKAANAVAEGGSGGSSSSSSSEESGVDIGEKDGRAPSIGGDVCGRGEEGGDASESE